MKFVYLALVEYLKDKKLVVIYLYVIYKLFLKYWKTLYDYIDVVSNSSQQIWEILKYFKQEKFTQKDIYNLLIHAIDTSSYNIYEIQVWRWLDLSDITLPIEWDVSVETATDDVGLFIKTANNKVYKRFVLDDVKKLLNL
jgi:hypothetical protein